MIDFKILVVDDEMEFRDAYSLILSDNGYDVLMAASGEQCLEILQSKKVDLVITDLKMGKMNGLELLSKIKEKYKDCEVIMVTGYGTVDSAVKAIKQGAFGYFVKGHNPDLLLSDVEKLVKIKSLQLDNWNLKYGLPKGEYLMTTKNEQLRNLLEIAEKAASSNTNILILGESGTGKEVVAKFIHQLSDRKEKAFIPVSCQMFSEGVLESELFGHEKGSFTGASERRIGRFEEADKGTLFLDEIGELSLSTQSKLLRVLENRCFERIGSNKPINLNIRLISATNRKLDNEIKAHTFREDLLYRINTITLYLPPLRERKEDLELLIKFFLDKFQKETKKKILYIEDGVMEILQRYDYPGNIRELRNIIERLVVLSEDAAIKIWDLPDIFRLRTSSDSYVGTPINSLKEIRIEAEVSHISKTLSHCNGNITHTAKVLGISRRQLFNKIIEYGIKK